MADTQIAPAGSRLSFLPIAGKPKEKPEMPMGRQIVIAGHPKTGKSTACEDARKPLFFDFENRLRHISGNRVSPIYVPEDENGNPVDISKNPYPFNKVLSQIERGKRVQFLMDWLKEMGTIIREDAATNIQTIIFDTVDTLLSHACQSFAYDNRRVTLHQRDYAEVYAMLLPLLEGFGRLPVDIIYTCHVDEFGVGTEQKVVLSLTPKIREWITSHADMILYVYQPGDGALNRFMCHNKPGLPSGDGTGKLPEDLPARMQAVYECWRGGDPEQFQPEVARWKTANIPVSEPPKSKRKARDN
jgi:hypothetical protein